MKRLVAILLISFAASATAQTPAAPAPPPGDNLFYDVRVQRGRVTYDFVVGRPGLATPLAALQYAFAFAKAGDLVRLTNETYECGPTKLIAPPCPVIGEGPGSTVIHGTWQIDNFDGSGAGCGVGLQDGSILKGLSVIDDCANPAEDGTAVGFNSNAPPNCSAKLIDCCFSTNDWAVYNWTPGSTLVVKNCKIRSGRMGIAGENSGLGQNFAVDDCDIDLDATKSQSQGATSNVNAGGAYGILFRGGTLKVDNTRIHCLGAALPGPSFAPWTCAISDYHAAGPANCTIELRNVACDVSGGDPAKCFDLRITNPLTQKTMKVIGGDGSGANGAFTRTSQLPAGQPFGMIWPPREKSIGSLKTMFGLEFKIDDQTKAVREAAQKGSFKNFGHAAASIAKDVKSTLETEVGPSAPGSPPHTHRGAFLRRAIQFDYDKESAVIGPVASLVGQAGAAHEFGGDYKGTNFPARPFMFPALERAIPRIGGDWTGSIGN